MRHDDAFQHNQEYQRKHRAAGDVVVFRDFQLAQARAVLAPVVAAGFHRHCQFTSAAERADEQRHQQGNHRLRAGEEVVVFNGTGRQWRGPIRFDQQGAYVALVSTETPLVEPPVRMTLVQALVSPEKLDWIVEKAVETGVSEIVLTPAARSVTKLAGERLEKRLQKLRDIAVSAAEQCGRNVVPEIRGASSFKEAMLGTQADRRLVLAPGAAHGTRLTGEEKSVAFAVGPEGGFSPEEIDLAEEAGWLAVLLGPRVLRTETAGIAAAVWLNTLTGDYGER